MNHFPASFAEPYSCTALGALAADALPSRQVRWILAWKVTPTASDGFCRKSSWQLAPFLDPGVSALELFALVCPGTVQSGFKQESFASPQFYELRESFFQAC